MEPLFQRHEFPESYGAHVTRVRRWDGQRNAQRLPSEAEGATVPELEVWGGNIRRVPFLREQCAGVVRRIEASRQVPVDSQPHAALR